MQGGNLNIESQQDSQKYDEKYTSGGLNVNINYATGAGISGGASSGTTKSDYNSVTDKAAFMQAKAASISPSIKILT